jgi:Tol biopolymer transport system component
MPIPPSEWARANDIFHRAVLLPETARQAFIVRECQGDAELCVEVESLVQSHRDTTAMLRGSKISVGTSLGVYDIVEFIAAGGMGEVYRARDTRLKRDVALKILPESFAGDRERLARFQREAEVLASLNHPNIAAIYGLEQADGVQALVMELVEGPTLAERIAQGAIPVDDALPIARQIAEALEAAHEQGIIHRDLKPANIKVRPDGTVKVLDFGLAKALEPASTATRKVTRSPTFTAPAMTTGIGVLLGTAAYMSPEQARGEPADKRSDIWAFGCLLFEMLTGNRPFDGEDVLSTLANVLKIDPDWSALPSEIPAAIRPLLQGCLTKDRQRRVADISTALFVLDKAASLAAPVGTASPAALPRRPLWWRVAALAGVVLAVAAVTGTAVWFATRPTPPAVVRTTITTSGSTALTLSGQERDVAITPDGSRVIYRGNNQLLVRSLNQLEPEALTGLGAPQGVFTSPDGKWIGFFDGVSLLKKVAINGGLAVTLCAIQGVPLGATWSEDGTIIFATNAPATGLQRVSAAGGEPTVLTKPDRERGGEGDHVWPEFLPGGEAVLFTITPANGSIENAQIALLDLRTGTSKVLIRGGSHAHYMSTGHLVYGVTGTLRAVAFNLGRLEVVGTPTPVLERVVTTGFGAADIAVAANGSLVYVPGGVGSGGQQTIVSVDRQGRATPLPGLSLDSYRDVRVSPDGARLALATQNDVWIYDLSRATLSRLTTDAAPDTRPLWTLDGQRIIFTSRRAGYLELFWRPADGTGSDERLLGRARDLIDLQAAGWSADGRRLLFTEVQPSHQCVIGQIAIERPSDANVLMKDAFCNWYPAVSPEGGWMAYDSNVSGREEIYIERYPELGNRQQISTGGGRIPLWSRDGRELFFSSLDGRQMLAVPVQSGTTLATGRPQVLFEIPMVASLSFRPYDIAPDGRFLIIRSEQPEAGGGTASNLIVVQNWSEELKRLVPTK